MTYPSPVEQRRSVALVGIFCACALFASACSSPTAPGNLDLSDTVALAGGNTLVFQNAARIVDQRDKIEQVVADTVAVVRPLLPFAGVTIIAGVGTANVIPEIGFGGRADAGTIWLTFDPDSTVWVAALDTELFPLLAHEMHHTARMRTVGYGDDLLGAMISEGLADQFAVEVAGGDPPRWSTALDAHQLATWEANARQAWFDRNYSHDAWFFGTAPPIPRWAGYTIGFEMTGRFLVANPSRRASDLHAEPASSFIPAPARH